MLQQAAHIFGDRDHPICLLDAGASLPCSHNKPKFQHCWRSGGPKIIVKRYGIIGKLSFGSLLGRWCVCVSCSWCCWLFHTFVRRQDLREELWDHPCYRWTVHLWRLSWGSDAATASHELRNGKSWRKIAQHDQVVKDGNCQGRCSRCCSSNQGKTTPRRYEQARRVRLVVFELVLRFLGFFRLWQWRVVHSHSRSEFSLWRYFVFIIFLELGSAKVNCEGCSCQGHVTRWRKRFVRVSCEKFFTSTI